MVGCGQFAVELVSETDDVEETQSKMQEYVDNGLRLGWLINPRTRQVEIYRPNQAVEVLQSPTTLSGEDVLPGFILDCPFGSNLKSIRLPLNKEQMQIAEIIEYHDTRIRADREDTSQLATLTTA